MVGPKAFLVAWENKASQNHIRWITKRMCLWKRNGTRLYFLITWRCKIFPADKKQNIIVLEKAKYSASIRQKEAEINKSSCLQGHSLSISSNPHSLLQVIMEQGANMGWKHVQGKFHQLESQAFVKCWSTIVSVV